MNNCCKNGQLCKLHQYLLDTYLEAQRVLANLPPTPWYKALQYDLACFDWWAFLWVLVIFKLLFG